MQSSSRIAINTAATYTRSLLGVGLALFSSRWILQALGATDFGLFQVVGSLIVFLTFFNSVMASSAARHFAFAIGKGNTEDVNRWFNTSLSIHLILPAVLIVIGWPIAEYAIRHWLTIPPERIDACVTVFRISLLGAFVNMASIPFIAMFNAKQHIAEVSMWDMLQTFLVFALAWTLTKVATDRLIFYAMGMVGTHILIHSIKIIRARILFPECRIRLQTGFDFHRLKELFHFAGWSLFGGISLTLRTQGSSILLNLYHGPVLNAAFGIARQVSNQANQLSMAMQTAFSPEITAREGRGEYARVMALAHFSSKIGCIMVMLFAIPLIVEMDYMLDIWLEEPPLYTAIFCRLILVTFLIDRLTTGYMMAVNARGKIAAYQASVGGILLLALPIACFCFWLGFSPVSLVISFVITSALATFGRVLWLKKLFGEPVHHWTIQVLTPCVIIGLVALSLSSLPIFMLPQSFLRLVLATGLGLLAIALSAWGLGLSKPEKSFVINIFGKVLRGLKDKGHKNIDTATASSSKS